MRCSEPSWFAVYTKPRQEAIALLNLERQGFDCFLPMAENPYQRRTEKFPRHDPLFPRYLFLNAIPEVQNLAAVRSTRGVVGLVRMGYQLIQVNEAIIQGLRARMHPETGLIGLDPVVLEEGDSVRVFDGPFVGAEGILQERCGQTRSMLLLNILGRETTVEVDSMLLQRAG
jgi:transcriptional antiterminator RfaH